MAGENQAGVPRNVPVIRYEPALDGLRAIAAVCVVGYHLRLPGFGAGYLGVDIFFVLSGFLISRILAREALETGSARFWRFYYRRFLRLFPAYIATVIACVVGDFFVADVGGTLKGAGTSLVYMSNWAVGIADVSLGSLRHCWSLSIEEQFYLVWPLCLVTVIRRWPSRLMAIVVAALTLAMASTAVGLFAGLSVNLISNATPSRAIEFLAGALLAIAPARRASTPRHQTLVGRLRPYGEVLCLAGLAVMATISGIRESRLLLIVWPAVAVLTNQIILAGTRAGSPVRRLLSARPLVAVGRTSYGLYLWHFPILSTIDVKYGLDTWPAKLAGVAITSAVVPISYFVIERPFLTLKDSGAAPPALARLLGRIAHANAA